MVRLQRRPQRHGSRLRQSIDLTYVGPNPAINAYARSRGAEVRIVAGAANGGAALVVQPDAPMRVAADFRGKRIGTPQLGNTQDVAARAWLAAGGLKITQTGGDAHVLPTANPDQILLFKQKQLDAVWTVEPWVSRLQLEAQGKVLIEESDAITTVLAARVEFMRTNRELVRQFVAAHRELTDGSRPIRPRPSAWCAPSWLPRPGPTCRLSWWRTPGNASS